MLDRAAACDPGGWFKTAAQVGNRYRVCGIAATYTMLHAIGPARGRLLQYKQALDDRRTCCVSFASMVFHAEEPSSTTDRDPCRNPCLTRAAPTVAADHVAVSSTLPGPGRFSR